MRIVGFYHSLVSDWNHGNAHFLRGIVRELQRRGHEVDIYESRAGWSRRGLVREAGEQALGEFRTVFPTLRPRLYDLDTLEPAEAVARADVVLVHEWTDPWLVRELGRLRSRGAPFALLFHDTHHRAVTAPEELPELGGYDGVLAYGCVLRDVYVRRAPAKPAWTWHEAADVELFRPLSVDKRAGDLVWIGNWGDGERADELEEFLIKPARRLRLRGSVYGVRYPEEAIKKLERAGLTYRGWAPNYRVPELFARHRVTIHVPRRPYVESLPGIPTIRPFEALSCEIPLVCAPWDDTEGLFVADDDYLVARDGREMETQIRRVLTQPQLARSLARQGRATILARHTCAHRVDELLEIVRELRLGRAA
jgi:spore maturation protein CgeB